MCDSFRGSPFLLLKAVDGHIGIVKRSEINNLLNKLKRDKTYVLADHPRIQKIKLRLFENGMAFYAIFLEKMCYNSSVPYALVYEHGDFTPWNIMKVNDTYIPFDFEYFVEDGLEYFDLIKYYYQTGRLLNGLRGKQLINYIITVTELPESKILLPLFLFKEILRSIEENESYTFEVELLNIIMDKQ